MKRFLYIFIFCCPLFILGQNVVDIAAKIDTNKISIGEQVQFDLSVRYPADVLLEWPSIDGKLGELEIVKQSDIDSQKGEADVLEKQSFKLTAFDSGYYAIPGLLFRYKETGSVGFTEIRSEAQLIRVETVAIDTTVQAIKGIKPAMDVPFLWSEAIPYALWALGGLLAMALLFYLWRRQKPGQIKEEVIVKKAPADETALRKLKELDSKKLWQAGKVKAYYSELTEILREYIEDHFGVQALEMTTDEIIVATKELELAPALREKFYSLLRMSDLVKFAKASPDVEDHQRSAKQAEDFVQHTKNSREKEEAEE